MAPNLDLGFLAEDNPFDDEDDVAVNSEDENDATVSALPMGEQLFAIATPSPQNEVYGSGDDQDSGEENNEEAEAGSEWKVDTAYGEHKFRGQLLHARCAYCLILDVGRC